MALKRTKEVDKLISQLEDIKNYFDELHTSRQDAFDNKSEKWQEGENGQSEEENLSMLEDLASEIETAFDSANNLFEED